MTIETISPASLKKAAELIGSGQLVAFPTETVYGLGADAFQPQACAAIFELKRRPSFDPLIVHLASAAELERVALEIPALARQLVARFWPGPLTLVLKKRPELPGIVSSGLDTVACRVPAHSAALALLQLCATPIAAPSANPFGFLSPTCAAHVDEQLGSALPLILDGGPCALGIESTIVDLSQGEPVLLRQGGLEAEAIEAELGRQLKRGAAVLERPLAPGQLASHYAPRTRLSVSAHGTRIAPAPGQASLLFQGEPRSGSACEVLSARGDLREAAANLFAALHRLDRSGSSLILAELAPEKGLGRAINDRLRKAAAAHV